jgi:hypothetical protein
MPELIQTYNFNSLYISALFLIYNLYKSNYYYINIIFSKIYLLDYTSVIIIINLLAIYLLLKNISFEINIKWTIKYK